MEYIPGIDLHKYVWEKNGLTELELWIVIKQILDALLYTHHKEIVHWDIKPANVMVTHNDLH